MNNLLAQKAQYYLNESHRLSEELQNETEYSELLENILVELIGEEAFYGLFEDLQTPERARETLKIEKKLKRIADRDSAKAYEAGEMGSADEAQAAHNKAANSAYNEIQAFHKHGAERASQTKLYGLGGKVVGKRTLVKRATEKVVRTPAKYSAFKKPSK
jgi:hypothetical protein